MRRSPQDTDSCEHLLHIDGGNAKQAHERPGEWMCQGVRGVNVFLHNKSVPAEVGQLAGHLLAWGGGHVGRGLVAQRGRVKRNLLCALLNKQGKGSRVTTAFHHRVPGVRIMVKCVD